MSLALLCRHFVCHAIYETRRSLGHRLVGTNEGEHQSTAGSSAQHWCTKACTVRICILELLWRIYTLLFQLLIVCTDIIVDKMTKLQQKLQEILRYQPNYYALRIILPYEFPSRPSWLLPAIWGPWYRYQFIFKSLHNLSVSFSAIVPPPTSIHTHQYDP